MSVTPRSTFAACVADVLGLAAGEVPLGDVDDVRLWLAERGLGLVPVADPAAFAWAGPWVGRLRGADGELVAVSRFGVPSGTTWNPAGADGELVEGYVVAPLDVAGWTPPPRPEPGAGVVEALLVAPDAEAPVRAVRAARALPGRGLEGDRYAMGRGTFGSGRPGSELTLVAAEVLEELGRPEHRRNVVTRGIDLNALVGREFTVGAVRCAGRRLCEPCAHLDRLAGGGVLRPLVHRGGLRADVLTEGEVRVGDPVAPA